MVMANPFEGKEVWFGVGSQDLYGEEAHRASAAGRSIRGRQYSPAATGLIHASQ